MCIQIIDWVHYYMYMKIIIYSVSQYMHLNAPRTTCLCIDTCYSKQTTISPAHFAAVPIASAGTVSAWHRGEAYKQS